MTRILRYAAGICMYRPDCNYGHGFVLERSFATQSALPVLRHDQIERLIAELFG